MKAVITTLLGVISAHSYLLQRLHLSDTRLLPVLHNLTPGESTRSVMDYLTSEDNNYTPVCSISLRHASAMNALQESVKIIQTENMNRGECDRISVGISSAVSEMQVLDAIHAGASYVSTMYHCESLLKIAQTCGTPMLSGVSTLREACKALEDGTNALKIFPSVRVPPKRLRSILDSLRYKYGSSFMELIPIIIAGGVKKEDISKYVSAGATGFAIGYDCSDAQTLKSFPRRLRNMHEYIERCCATESPN